MPEEKLVWNLAQAQAELGEAMREAVNDELGRTVGRWHDGGKRKRKYLREDPQDQETGRVLRRWSLLGNTLLWAGPWRAAIAADLYKEAARLSHLTEDQHPGLDLHKGIEYFAWGMALFQQGLFYEGAHYILQAIREDVDVGADSEKTVAAQKLNEELLREIPRFLTKPAQLCRDAGHTRITPEHVQDLAREMLYDHPSRTYRPLWALWLYGIIRDSGEQVGRSLMTPLRRLRALQDLTFLYEAALRERTEKVGEPLRILRDVVAKVSDGKGYPAVVPDEWRTFANFDAQDRAANADATLTKLQAERFGGVCDAHLLCYHALLTVGLVRNMVHHRIDLQSTLLNAEYGWVLDRVSAALLLSW